MSKSLCVLCFTVKNQHDFLKGSQVTSGYDDICYQCWKYYGHKKDEISPSNLEKRLIDVSKHLLAIYQQTNDLLITSNNLAAMNFMYKEKYQQTNDLLIKSEEIIANSNNIAKICEEKYQQCAAENMSLILENAELKQNGFYTNYDSDNFHIQWDANN